MKLGRIETACIAVLGICAGRAVLSIGPPYAAPELADAPLQMAHLLLELLTALAAMRFAAVGWKSSATVNRASRLVPGLVFGAVIVAGSDMAYALLDGNVRSLEGIPGLDRTSNLGVSGCAPLESAFNGHRPWPGEVRRRDGSSH